MGCSCSKSTSVGIVEERRPVRKLSGKDGRQPTPTGTQGQRCHDGKGPLKDGIGENRRNKEPSQDAKIQQTAGEENNQVQVETAVHGESTVVTDADQTKDQSSPNNDSSKDTVAEEVHEDSKDISVQDDELNTPGVTALRVKQKPPEPRTKKELIPNLEVFKDLDDRAVQAPEGHATIKDLVLYLIEPAKTPLEKARVLFRWVTSHIQYAVESYVTGSFKSQSTGPAAVFQQRISVCQGYSELYKEMCSLAEIKCVTISGRAKGAGYRVGQKFGPGSDHAWNAVEIDGKWYLLDCTWAAGNSDLQNRTFEFKYKEHYFFTDPEVFVTNHHPMDNQWQLLEEPVSLNIFENQVHFESSFFNLGLLPKFLSHTMSPVCTQNGEATISIKIPEPMSFMYHLYPSEGGNAQDENVLHEIVDNVAIFKIALPKKGSFLLELYGKRSSATGNYSQICSFMVDSDGSTVDHVPFPRLSTFTWGPGPWLLDGFISDVSHPKAIVTLPEGEAKIEFNSVKPLQYMCNMKEDGLKWSNYAMAQVNDLTASVYVRAPKTGQFTLTIWVKEEGDKTYSKSMYYLLKCNKCKTDASPYPKKYNSRCLLYEPLDGRLAGNRSVHFRVVCPNSEKVVVIANGKWQQLVRNADDSWEGDADTGEQGKILSVSRKKPGQKQYWTLLEYEVVA